VVGEGDDFVFVHLFLETVPFDVLEEGLFVGELVMALEMVMDEHFADRDFAKAFGVTSDWGLVAAEKEETAVCVVLGCLFFAAEGLGKDGPSVRVLPVAELGPHDVSFLAVGDDLEVDPPAYKLVDEARVVSLVDEYLQLLFFGEGDFADAVAVDDAVQEVPFLAFLSIKQSSFPPEL
jgi:hypothetical protein